MKTDYYHGHLTRLMHEKLSPEERVTHGFPEETRRKAAFRLSRLMRDVRPFSFVRMGSSEAGLLLAEQHGEKIEWAGSPLNRADSSSAVWCHPGIDMNLVPRLRAAYESAT